MLKKLRIEDFDKIYQLLEESFPKDEYRSYEKQKALFANPEYQIVIEEEEISKEIKAFIAAWEFPTFVYIEHFAVNPNRRNEGIGRKMLAEFVRLAGKQVVLEVEPPVGEMPVRRIGFYERNQFFFNDYPYVQPAMGEDRSEIPLFIMTSGGKVDESEFEQIRDLLYKKVYGKNKKLLTQK